MKLSAKEAGELMPRLYIPTDHICERIQAIAKSGLDYIFTDLTQGQVHEFEELGYKVERPSYNDLFKISWKRSA